MDSESLNQFTGTTATISAAGSSTSNESKSFEVIGSAINGINGTNKTAIYLNYSFPSAQSILFQSTLGGAVSTVPLYFMKCNIF